MTPVERNTSGPDEPQEGKVQKHIGQEPVEKQPEQHIGMQQGAERRSQPPVAPPVLPRHKSVDTGRGDYRVPPADSEEISSMVDAELAEDATLTPLEIAKDLGVPVSAVRDVVRREHPELLEAPEEPAPPEEKPSAPVEGETATEQPQKRRTRRRSTRVEQAEGKYKLPVTVSMVEQARREMLTDKMRGVVFTAPATPAERRRLVEARQTVAGLAGRDPSEVTDHDLAVSAAISLHREGKGVDSLLANSSLLIKGVTSLTDREHQVLWLYNHQGKNGPQIGTALGIARNVVTQTRGRISDTLTLALEGKERTKKGSKETQEVATLRGQVEDLLSAGRDRKAIMVALNPADKKAEDRIDHVLRQIRKAEARGKRLSD